MDNAIIENETQEESAAAARPRFVKDEKTGVTVVTFPGGDIKVLPPIDAEQKARLDGMMGDGGEPDAETIHAVKINDREWYVLESGIDGFMLFDCLVLRRKDDSIENKTRPGIRRIMAAMLLSCVVSGPKDDTPHFESIEDAEAEIKNPKTRVQTLALYSACCKHNSFLDKAANGPKAQSAAMVGDLTETASTVAPQLSHSDLENSNNSETTTAP
jgi:hypothetical protein